MLKNDYILVTYGTSTAERLGFIGQILQITNTPSYDDSLPYRVYFKGNCCWVNGIAATDLLKALI